MLYIGYNHEVGGIGDFVYILFQYYYYYNSRGLSSIAQNIQICITNHPLKKCIECVEPPDEYYLIRTIACASISNVFVKYLYNFPIASENVLLYSNMNDYLHLCVRHASPSKLAILRREFRETVFRVTPQITEYVDTLIAASPAFYMAQPARYVAIHVRLGDAYLRRGAAASVDSRCSPENVEQNFAMGVNFLRRRNGEATPIFIFCDNSVFKEKLAIKYGCYYFSTEVVHVAATETEETAIIDTFAEFVLLSRAAEIFAVSISNFSQVPAFIYDIPIFTVKSGEIIKCMTI